MLTTCPSCQKKLKLADNLQGKQVRCPACQQVFRVAAPPPAVAEVEIVPEPVQPRPAPRPVPRPAPPPPPTDDPFAMTDEPPARVAPRAGARRRAEPEPESDFEELAEAGADLEKGRRLARRGAGSLLFAVIIDVIAWVLFVVLLVTTGAGGAMSERARVGMWVIVVLSFLYFLPIIFMAVAAALLSNLRGRGMVITGCIMAFIAAVELLPYAGLWGLVVASGISGPGVRFDLLLLPLLLLIACVLGLVGSISAGIRGLVTLGKPAVKAAYR